MLRARRKQHPACRGALGGHDSTAMSLLLKEREAITVVNHVCTPTGDELPEMFQF